MTFIESIQTAYVNVGPVAGGAVTAVAIPIFVPRVSPTVLIVAGGMAGYVANPFTEDTACSVLKGMAGSAMVLSVLSAM